jgi:UDP-2,3-diacylglucosamine pyrophosphatase LpxH
MSFGHVEIRREYIYQTAKGKKLLLLHGDQFYNEVDFGRLKNWIGDKAYIFLLLLNRGFNAIRTKHGYPYWSLAGHIKTRIRDANDAIARYRQAAITRAKKKMERVLYVAIFIPRNNDNRRHYLLQRW